MISFLELYLFKCINFVLFAANILYSDSILRDRGSREIKKNNIRFIKPLFVFYFLLYNSTSEVYFDLILYIKYTVTQFKIRLL